MWCVALFVTALAQRKDETKNPVIGTWKFSKQTTINEFQKLFKYKRTYPTELFTFESNHSFRHELLDTKNNIVKIFNGNWKSVHEKIVIDYDDIDFKLVTDYFFLGNDLVMGKNFSHVIFTKYEGDANFAMK